MGRKRYVITEDRGSSRRQFLKSAAVVAAAATQRISSRAYAGAAGRIRVGLIGCGIRGTNAAKDCAEASPEVEIVAIGDVFDDQVRKSANTIHKALGERCKVTKDTMFTGFGAYKKVIASDVDLVLMAPPPQFRPVHVRAAVEAGKHVFMEKPVAVDPVGVRSIIESARMAEQRGLTVVAGTMKRHQNHYTEIMKRVNDGAIGEILTAQCHANVTENKDYWKNWEKTAEMSEMEWQIRNWPWWTWLSGDVVVELGIHGLDVINWAMGNHPLQCFGMGGRQVRTDPKYGNVFDHFAVEFEYPGGARVISMCRQQDGCTFKEYERWVGTKGVAYTDGSTGWIEGENAYRFDGPDPNPYVQEHVDLIKSIKGEISLNEGVRVAESTMTGVIGRMSAYTGRELKWDWAMNASKLDLTPPKYEFGDVPETPAAMPGVTQLM